MNGYEPDAGHIVWTDFDPRTGREQGGRRPALVISPVEFWRSTGFAFVAPITSKVRPFPSSVVLPPTGQVAGEILLGQTRSIDTLARPIRPTGQAAPAAVLRAARAKLAVLLGIAVTVLSRCRQPRSPAPSPHHPTPPARPNRAARAWWRTISAPSLTDTAGLFFSRARAAPQARAIASVASSRHWKA